MEEVVFHLLGCIGWRGLKRCEEGSSHAKVHCGDIKKSMNNGVWTNNGTSIGMVWGINEGRKEV